MDHRTPTYNVKLDEFVSIGWVAPWNNQAETDAGLKREVALAIISAQQYQDRVLCLRAGFVTAKIWTQPV